VEAKDHEGNIKKAINDYLAESLQKEEGGEGVSEVNLAISLSKEDKEASGSKDLKTEIFKKYEKI
jgi:hypothetical protein